MGKNNTKTTAVDPNWLEAPVTEYHFSPNPHTPRVGQSYKCSFCDKGLVSWNGKEFLHRADGTPECSDPKSIEQHCREVYEELHCTPEKPFVYSEFREWTVRMGVNQANLS